MQNFREKKHCSAMLFTLSARPDGSCVPGPVLSARQFCSFCANLRQSDSFKMPQILACLVAAYGHSTLRAFGHRERVASWTF